MTFTLIVIIGPLWYFITDYVIQCQILVHFTICRLFEINFHSRETLEDIKYSNVCNTISISSTLMTLECGRV